MMSSSPAPPPSAELNVPSGFGIAVAGPPEEAALPRSFRTSDRGVP